MHEVDSICVNFTSPNARTGALDHASQAHGALDCFGARTGAPANSGTHLHVHEHALTMYIHPQLAFESGCTKALHTFKMPFAIQGMLLSALAAVIPSAIHNGLCTSEIHLIIAHPILQLPQRLASHIHEHLCVITVKNVNVRSWFKIRGSPSEGTLGDVNREYEDATSDIWDRRNI